MNVDFPLRVDGRGRTGAADDDRHLRNLIGQVVLTAPGERVMRPDFGSGLLGLVFEPGGDETAATTQHLVQGALQRWLGHLLTVEAVEVTAVEGALLVSVSYVVHSPPARRQDEFRVVAP